MSLTPFEFDYVRSLVLEGSAIVLDPGKEYLVESRLTPLATRLGLGSLNALIGKLRTEPRNGIHKQVVDAMTTNETSFFRDLHPFEILKKNIVPEFLTKRSSERTLRIWSAACSTGQEPYTIALLLRETFPQLSGWQVRILATDLSADVLNKARTGTYSQMEMNRGLPAMLLVKYFKKVGADQWQVRDDLRGMIEFKEFNLAVPFPPLPSFDVILLRNVLIYFDIETKRSILAKMRKVLTPDGYLFLGGSETTLNIDENFESVCLGKSVCYRKRR